MAKEGYPGLVLVPPSDRQIARRRLARWTGLTVAMISGISALNIWLPMPSEKITGCETGIDLERHTIRGEGCNQADQSITETAPLGQRIEVGTDASQSVAQSTLTRVPAAPPLQQITRSTVATAAISPPKKPPATLATLTEQSASAPILLASPTTSPSPPSNADTHLAERGDAFAQYRLGRFYARQNGPEAPESVSWYVKASAGLRRLAETGNGEAMYVLGVMYAFGRGVKKDREEARRWLTQAVERQVAAARPVLMGLDKHRLAEADRAGRGG